MTCTRMTARGRHGCKYRGQGRPVQFVPHPGAAAPSVSEGGGPVRMLLDGKKLLITGVLTDDSIAFSIARVAQEAGAEVLLTGVGRGMSLTQRVAKRLPTTPRVPEMDGNNPAAVGAGRGRGG